MLRVDLPPVHPAISRRAAGGMLSVSAQIQASENVHANICRNAITSDAKDCAGDNQGDDHEHQPQHALQLVEKHWVFGPHLLLLRM